MWFVIRTGRKMYFLGELLCCVKSSWKVRYKRFLNEKYKRIDNQNGTCIMNHPERQMFLQFFTMQHLFDTKQMELIAIASQAERMFALMLLIMG
mmetsp:Transcript_13006/g.18939  ORF Transcript_13006/g.18939 Transcript_13006/m.18939 type:complete len:94 (+) Transcript_13006:1337-1618(+)